MAIMLNNIDPNDKTFREYAKNIQQRLDKSLFRSVVKDPVGFLGTIAMSAKNTVLRSFSSLFRLAIGSANNASEFASYVGDLSKMNAFCSNVLASVSSTSNNFSKAFQGRPREKQSPVVEYIASKMPSVNGGVQL